MYSGKGNNSPHRRNCIIYSPNQRIRETTFNSGEDLYKIHEILVCLFFGGGLSHLRISHLYGDVPITSEGRQILTYAQHSWQLSSEGSHGYHTYCDMEHPFIMVILEDLRHSHLLPSVWQWSCHYLF